MEALLFALFIGTGIAGGHDMGTAQKMTATCIEQGYTQAVYVEGSGFDYECQ